MNKHQVLEKYVQICSKNLSENKKITCQLNKKGLHESFLMNSFQLGYSSGNFNDLIGSNTDILDIINETGLIKNDKEIFPNHLVIPIYNEDKILNNLAFYSIHSRTKNKVSYLNEDGIFNAPFLKNNKRIIFTDNLISALLLIQTGYPDTTFLFGDNEKYLTFFQKYNITNAVFTFEGHAELFALLTSNGISTKRVNIDFSLLAGNDNAEKYLDKIFNDVFPEESNTDDRVRQIENGFVFRFEHLNYRIIGNFSEYTISLKANIKAYKDDEVFVDQVDLYKNRERQNYIFNIMDKFNIRDQIQLENDLNKIMEVIEKHKENKDTGKQSRIPELTDYQKNIGLSFLKNPDLINEIAEDISKLGYVREKKNKILLYLLMTSRLMDNPLHALIVSRSGAGKSYLVDIVEKLCPPEQLKSISDLSANALFYYGENDLKNKFIVIGETEGSKDSEYPLRELISKKSISKAIPVKDQTTGVIKTECIKVNGPIALAETTTSSKINPENINRCFVLGIDESEEQTQLIHNIQRKTYTLEGHLNKKYLNKIIEKHIYAQRLLKQVNVFNPYAPLLTFPSARLQTRRDNEKLLKLINIICFLHQHQRKINKHPVNKLETIEYIECTVNDYKIAYELLIDGILKNTLDDLPRPARELLEIIKKYLDNKNKQDNTPKSKIIFNRKEIREYSSWSFAQIRNNFRILTDYEYLRLVKSKNGSANQYRLAENYNDLDFLNTILTPEQLENKIKENKKEEKILSGCTL